MTALAGAEHGRRCFTCLLHVQNLYDVGMIVISISHMQIKSDDRAQVAQQVHGKAGRECGISQCGCYTSDIF